MQEQRPVGAARNSAGGPSTLPVLCRACGRPIESADRFCRYCGRRQSDSSAWYYHPVGILILAFFVVGPFALPLVFLSPRLSKRAKAVMATAISIYGLIVVYYTYKLTMLLMQLSVDIMGPIELYR